SRRSAARVPQRRPRGRAAETGAGSRHAPTQLHADVDEPQPSTRAALRQTALQRRPPLDDVVAGRARQRRVGPMPAAPTQVGGVQPRRTRRAPGASRQAAATNWPARSVLVPPSAALVFLGPLRTPT